EPAGAPQPLLPASEAARLAALAQNGAPMSEAPAQPLGPATEALASMAPPVEDSAILAPAEHKAVGAPIAATSAPPKIAPPLAAKEIEGATEIASAQPSREQLLIAPQPMAPEPAGAPQPLLP